LQLLEHLRPTERLFTYKVAHDGGSAPNPYHDVCTLGICKPAIRRVASAGDVVVGFDCAPDQTRIIYCMVVDHVLPWQTYIAACTGSKEHLHNIPPANLHRKVPRNANDPGDCIWPTAEYATTVLPSWSDHGGPEDFRRDVQDGENVILSSRYWYFGAGDKHTIHLAPGDLRDIIPGRGHRSNANADYRQAFVDFFNHQLIERSIAGYGQHGDPEKGPGFTDDAARSRCRAQERDDDDAGEEPWSPTCGPGHC
jgi:hypothetical protein